MLLNPFPLFFDKSVAKQTETEITKSVHSHISLLDCLLESGEEQAGFSSWCSSYWDAELLKPQTVLLGAAEAAVRLRPRGWQACSYGLQEDVPRPLLAAGTAWLLCLVASCESFTFSLSACLFLCHVRGAHLNDLILIRIPV